MVPYGRAIAQRISYPGDSCEAFKSSSTGEVWHLDVGSSHPGAVVGPKGWAVHGKVARELGSERRETVRSLSVAGVKFGGSALIFREDQSGLVYQLSRQRHRWVTM